MRVLITVPDLKKPGGVASLYRILKMEFYFNNISLFTVHGNFPDFIRIPFKYFSFFFKIFQYDIIHLNPSLSKKSFLRDSLFAAIARLCKKKIIVYWHGWEVEFEKKIEKNGLLNLIARYSFFKADTTIVLGTVFKRKLERLGYKKNIIIETNAADNHYILNRTHKCVNLKRPITLVFLSRLEVKKGVYIAIETLNILNRTGNNFRLIIAGSGSEENNVRQLIKGNAAIEWAGYVDGLAKHNLLLKSHIMFLPSWFSEGLPITILEGMMYGLPIIACPIGGIPDIVDDSFNGFLIEDPQPQNFANGILKITSNPMLFAKISNLNMEKSKGFAPCDFRRRLYGYYETLHNQVLF